MSDETDQQAMRGLRIGETGHRFPVLTARQGRPPVLVQGLCGPRPEEKVIGRGEKWKSRVIGELESLSGSCSG